MYCRVYKTYVPLVTHLRPLIRNYCTQPQKIYPERVFSGIQPTGCVHIGNYLGAIQQWINLQNSGKDILLSIVDLHAMTVPHNPKELSKNILLMAATLIACGIDPQKVILFQQSAVPQHTELCWELGCISTMARLAHLPQYKEKSAGMKDIPLGLFVYPVLQSADILIYKATHVPVGEDQVQQIQLSQDLARMFNSRFGETFPIPHAMLPDKSFARIKSLRDPTKKMSKSDPDQKSKITLLDTPDEVKQKIKKAVTDFTSAVTFNPVERPGVSNIISIHSVITGKSIEQILSEASNLDTGKYKLYAAEEIAAGLKPIKDNIDGYLIDPHYLLDILNDGAERARLIADRTIKEVRQKMGLTLKMKVKKREDVIINK